MRDVLKKKIYTRISLFGVESKLDGILDISLFTNRQKGEEIEQRKEQEEEKKRKKLIHA